MTSAELERQTEKLLGGLAFEFEESFRADEVIAIGNAYLERLSRDATVGDFIPLLVYRFTKEELASSTYEELHRAT